MILQRRDGDDMVWTATDRNPNGASTEAFRINGVSGAVTVNGGTALPSFVTQAAYTQTYATAARTVPAATTHVITDSSTGAASTTTIAAITSAGNAGSADITPTKNAIATLAAELALANADILALKKVVNAIIDDLQAVLIAG